MQRCLGWISEGQKARLGVTKPPVAPQTYSL